MVDVGARGLGLISAWARPIGQVVQLEVRTRSKGTLVLRARVARAGPALSGLELIGLGPETARRWAEHCGVRPAIMDDEAPDLPEIDAEEVEELAPPPPRPRPAGVVLAPSYGRPRRSGPESLPPSTVEVQPGYARPRAPGASPRPAPVALPGRAASPPTAREEMPTRDLERPRARGRPRRPDEVVVTGAPVGPTGRESGGVVPPPRAWTPPRLPARPVIERRATSRPSEPPKR